MLTAALSSEPRGLGAPEVGGLFTHWSLQPLALLAALALLGWYLGAARVQARTASWPARRTATFVVGVVVLVWTTCGWPESYRGALYWVWTGQTLALWLVVPIVLLAGQPLQLAMARGGATGRVSRLLRSRTVRALANPVVGPALVPILSAVLFFGPVPEWAVRWDAVAWVLQIVLVVVGALMVLPLVGPDTGSSSLAVGLALAIGSLELVLDAIPGIALRLHTTTVTNYFDHRSRHSWTPGPLHDQRTAGAILWCLAELIDLPFLLLVFRRWLAADAREAAEADAVLEAERTARAALLRARTGGAADASASGDLDAAASDGDVPADEPWWLTDPQMRRRGFGAPRPPSQ